MNKHNLLGSVLLGCLMAFVLVMPAFASEEQASSRSAIKGCVKAVEVEKRANIKAANETFKASERAAILAWKSAVDAAKDLEPADRRAALKAANETMRASLKAAKEIRREAEKLARETMKDDAKSCRKAPDTSTTKDTAKTIK